MAERERECPICASRNVSLSGREHALVCRDCGSVVAGKPVALPPPREEVVREIIPDLSPRSRVSRSPAKKAKPVKKAKKAPKKVAKKTKKIVKKAVKKKAVKKKAVKKTSKKKSFMHRLMRRR